MANHCYFVPREMATAELCLFGGVLQLYSTGEQASMRYHRTTSQIEKAEFVTNVQPTAKVFGHFMNRKFTREWKLNNRRNGSKSNKVNAQSNRLINKRKQATKH
jgi:hypothetical protein